MPLDPSVRPSPALFDLASFAHGTYEVNRLVDFRFQAGIPYVRVSWEGFDAADDTWEPVSRMLKDVPALVRAYLRGKLSPLELKQVNRRVRGLSV